jgi:hypothetical protein
MNNWQRKILAFLHDPPEKSYNYGPQHKDRVALYLSRLGIHEHWEPAADHAAAAADRFIFPAVTGLGEGVSFRHPLHPRTRLRSEFPEEADAMEILSSVFPEFPALDAREAHWLLWRCWLHQP